MFCHLAKLIKIGQTVAEIWWFNVFSKMAAVCHLGFVGPYSDYPLWALGGLLWYAKFGWNQCSSWGSCQLSSSLPTIPLPILWATGALCFWPVCQSVRASVAYVRECPGGVALRPVCYRLLLYGDFLNIHISQGSVTIYLRCRGIFEYEFTAYLPLSLQAKEF